ncbi:MAG: hypothetical protein ABFS45_06550 [Pseudomonadota bacterium]
MNKNIFEKDAEFYIFDLLLHVRMGRQLHKNTLEFIADAITPIFRGENPRDVLNLSPEKDTYGVPHDRAFWVEIARLHCKTYDEAKEMVAEATGKSFSTISKCHDAYQRDAKAWLAGWQDNIKLICACRVENIRDTHASLDNAIAAVAEEYGLPFSDIKRFHNEFLQEEIEDLSECKPPNL